MDSKVAEPWKHRQYFATTPEMMGLSSPHFRLLLASGILCFLTTPTSALKDTVTEDDENAFMQWLKEHGVDTTEFEIASTPLGRGIRTLVPKPVGSVLFTVPKELILHTGLARNSEIGFILDGLKAQGNIPRNVFAVFLTYELLKGPRSFWHPYFRVVPYPRTIPLYWEEADFSLIKQSPSLLSIYRGHLSEHNGQADVFFESVFSKHPNFFPGSKEQLLDAYRFASAFIVSRAWGFLGHDVGAHELDLVPLADMLNHADDAAELSVVHADTGEHMGHGFKSTRDYKIGDQLFDSYEPRNKRCNHMILIGYGFTMEDPLRDCIQISLGAFSLSALSLCTLSLRSLPTFFLYILSRGYDCGSDSGCGSGWLPG